MSLQHKEPDSKFDNSVPRYAYSTALKCNEFVSEFNNELFQRIKIENIKMKLLNYYLETNPRVYFDA